jgi:pimeloyl-ACP methyl ester carboxylesterase
LLLVIGREMTTGGMAGGEGSPASLRVRGGFLPMWRSMSPTPLWAPRIALCLLSAILAGIPGVAAQTPGEKGPGESAGALNLEDCTPPGVSGTARCGTYGVWENRSKGEGRRIDLKIMVLPPLEEGARGEPLFFLAGGPGGAATQMAAAMELVYPDLRRASEIVLMDRRGTGGSNPLQCAFADLDSRVRAYLEVDVGPEALRECRSSFDADLTWYGSQAAVDDLEEVRRALGYDRINLFGVSYGTREALVYARRHGKHLRTMTLHGVVPLALTLPAHVAADAQAALEDLWSECERDESCRSAHPEPRRRLRAVLDRLAKEPVTVETKHPFTQSTVTLTVTKEIFTAGLRGLLYANAFSRAVPHDVERAYQGDFEPFATRAITFAEAMARTLHLGLYLSVVCTEELPEVNLRDAIAEAAGTFHGDSLVRNHLRACDSWVKGERPEGYRLPVRSAVPTLLISGGADPVTGPRWGEEAARHLSASEHLVVPHAGHADAVGTCEQKIISEFVASGTLSGLDTAGCASSGRERQWIVERPEASGS